MSPPERKETQIGNDTSKKIQEFNDHLSELVKGSTNEATRLRSFIERRLYQYRLRGRYTYHDVLSEVYVRGHHAIIYREVEISNIAGWIRKTASYIVSEKLREQAKLPRFIPFDFVDEFADEGNIDLLEALYQKEERSVSAQRIKKAMEHLSDADREIIRLRFVEGYSWKDITQRLGGKHPGMYRQRGSRAISRLRAAYKHLFDENDN